MENTNFPKIDVMPIVDRIVDAGLWVGRLFTKQVVHEVRPLSDHFQDPVYDTPDHFPLRKDIDLGVHDATPRNIS